MSLDPLWKRDEKRPARLLQQSRLMRQLACQGLINRAGSIFIACAPQTGLARTIIIPPWIIHNGIPAQPFEGNTGTKSQLRLTPHIGEPIHAVMFFGTGFADQERRL